jgi:hypothetical protein
MFSYVGVSYVNSTKLSIAVAILHTPQIRRDFVCSHCPPVFSRITFTFPAFEFTGCFPGHFQAETSAVFPATILQFDSSRAICRKRTEMEGIDLKAPPSTFCSVSIGLMNYIVD